MSRFAPVAAHVDMCPVFRRLAECPRPVGVPSIPGPRRGAQAEETTPPLDARTLVLLVLEVLDGRRPLAHLAELTANHGLMCRLRVARQVRTTSLVGFRVCHPARHAAEISATVRRGRRVLAVAARADWRAGRWWLSDFVVLS
ncbi:hypothetical protein FKR81_34080 [Lentzea tibetensis]|uniref:Uncharacterized protein n=1 Tax=Lentzea tibetensis TaxID=2591470 RepID=A0A563EJG7_9PSEU|nr:Rv3235 family protein [Lentzea tibetensis]TWP46842.1 hypothetical protein FKR81_34080 [Lentzea tibetensis]